MTDTLIGCKEAFEEWYREFWNHEPPIALNCKAHEGMTYGNISTENAWKGWQAAWNHQRREIPVVDAETVADIVFTAIKHGDEKHQQWLRDNLTPAVEKALMIAPKREQGEMLGDYNMLLTAIYKDIEAETLSEGHPVPAIAIENAAQSIMGTIAPFLTRPKREAGGEYPECSGDPKSCPENEGHGCCGGKNAG